MNKAIIIFSGFNPRAAVSFIRTLETNGVTYGIIAKSEEDDIFLTKYSDRVFAVRSVMQLDAQDLKSSIESLQTRLKADEYIIAPSTEALNRFLLNNKAILTELNCYLPLVEKELYETISDKQSFGALCKTNNILVPDEFNNIDSTDPSFVAKPKTYLSKDNKVHTPILINGQKEKDNFLAQYNVDDFYFQEYITGESLYLLYYFYKNGDLVKFSQNNYMQQLDGKSIVGAESTDFHLSPESEKYEKLFRSLSFRGLVMVEVKRQDNNIYMIEANPRFWGPSQLFIDAGVNLFEAFLADIDIIPERPAFLPKNKNTKYFWHGGINYIDNEPQLAFHNYNRVQLQKNFADWLAADIYNRKDTKDLYKVEIERDL